MEIKTIDLDKIDSSTQKPSYQTEFTISDVNNNSTLKTKLITTAIFILIAIAGFYTGAVLKTSLSTKSTSSGGTAQNIQAEVPTAGVKVGDVYGSADERAFKDSATGVIQKGGFNGEGTHSLLRPGGPSQTVYLTSSVIDLDTMVGDQVTIWGETFKGQKAAWLMDVGRVKVENLNAPLPK